jgi:hypothetical protein
MIGARELELMKPTVLIINTCRGAVIHDVCMGVTSRSIAVVSRESLVGVLHVIQHVHAMSCSTGTSRHTRQCFACRHACIAAMPFPS